MKKLFTLCLSFLLGGLAFNAQAQDAIDNVFQFTDEDTYEVIPDGSYIVRNTIEQIPGGSSLILGKLYITEINDVAEKMYLYIVTNVKTYEGLESPDPSNPERAGRFQICFPDGCQAFQGVGTQTSPVKEVLENIKGDFSLNTELQLAATDRGECEVTYQVFRCSDMDGSNPVPGSKITVLYTVNQDTGISGVTTTESREVVARYTLDGQLLSAPQKGINIVKYADGRTEKVLVK